MLSNFRKNKKTLLALNLFLKLSLFFVLGLITFLIIANTNIYFKRKQLMNQVQSLQSKINQIKSQNETLEVQIENSDNGQYIEKVAREELDLQKPGEKVYSFIRESGQEKQENSDSKSFLQNWFGWLTEIFK